MCVLLYFFFFFKQKTAYEMRISDWSSDVCSSDLLDLKEAAEIARTDGEDILGKMRDPFNETMRGCRKPIIAAMTGSLMAGGMMLALNCDLRVDRKSVV